MGIRTMAGFAALLFLIFLIPASAVMTVSEARVNTTLVVSGLPQGADIQFVLNNGVPVLAKADAIGTARYLPLNEGSLEIIVMQGGVVSERKTVTVLPEVTAAPAQTTPSPTSIAGSGGGGGMATAEPFENIEKTERKEKSLISNIPVMYDFAVPEFSVYQIAVTGSENENLVSIRVEALKGTSKLVTTSAPGIIYKNINVWPGTKRIKKAVIRFKVENSWLGNNSLAGGDIKMLRWDTSKWVALETKEINNDARYTYFEAASDKLSNLAIAGLKGEAVPAASTVEATETPVEPKATVPAVPKPKASGFEVIIAILALSLIYMLGKKR